MIMQKLLGIVALGLLLIAVSLVHASHSTLEPLQQIASYKQWTKVKPLILESIAIDRLSIAG